MDRDCEACGDEAKCTIVREKWKHFYCKECYQEILHGFVPKIEPLNIVNGGYRSPDDDRGPWQENAIRFMEGD